jgi:diaminopimelate epimerase
VENANEFYKYQGTGNDFVMIDRELLFPKSKIQASSYFIQTFGIGGRWPILLENDPESILKNGVWRNHGGSQYHVR